MSCGWVNFSKRKSGREDLVSVNISQLLGVKNKITQICVLFFLAVWYVGFKIVGHKSLSLKKRKIITFFIFRVNVIKYYLSTLVHILNNSFRF